MDTIHITQTNGDDTSVHPRPPSQHIAPLPTHNDFIEILTAAMSDVQGRYGHIPRLCTILTETFQDSITDHESIKLDPRYDPERALITTIRVERKILNAYNKHRLGDADWRYEYHSAPEGRTDYYETHNLPEHIDTFPFHAETLRRGFRLPDLELRPLYQASDPNAAVTTIGTPSAAGTDPKGTPSRTSGYGIPNYGKLSDAPSAGLPFPNGNITLAEIAAFLPESIKSWDIIDRVIGNGASSAILAKLINHFRDMPQGPIASNSVYRTMKCPMNFRAKLDRKWEKWTVGTHQDIANQNLDATSVSVAGFQHAGNTIALDIPFKDLANGVRVFPTGHDALDLTRCVIYCQQHPEENWLYPTDYARLLNHLPAGPAQVEKGHHDAAVIARWNSESSIRLTARIRTLKRDACGRLLKKDGEDGEDEEENGGDESVTPLSAKRTKSVSKAPSRSKAPASLDHVRTEYSTHDMDSNSDSDTYQGPKKMKKRMEPVRTSSRTRLFAGSYSIDDALGVDEDDEME